MLRIAAMTVVAARLGGAGARRDIARLLSLAAAPTFAGMAVLTAVFGSAGGDVICRMSAPGLPLDGMAVMYGLMAGFHLAPWLQRLSGEGRR